ncbi:MAG: aldo/keto reductase [Deltaproteobacteria bacterium]|nr:aldo/keto reductase [Deltaproteobacteria bacterium]
MRTRSLGRSGLTVGELGLGTWGLSGEGYGPVTEEAAWEALTAAAEEGVTFFECADAYREGKVQELLGRLLREHKHEGFTVCTRLGIDRASSPPRKRFGRAHLTAACDASLQRLGRGWLDVCLLHNPLLSTLQEGEAWEALERLKEAGKARLIGASVSSAEAGRVAVKLGAEVLEVPYNLLYPEVLHGLSAEVSAGQVAVIARSPLSYGLLADTWNASRRFGDEDHRLYRWGPADLARRVRQRESARFLVHDAVGSLREAALRYVLANGLVSVTVPGPRTAAQARQNARAAEGLPYLPDEDLSALGRFLREAGVDA